jgi:glycosyltransferase involved in cell wall biosynthesis
MVQLDPNQAILCIAHNANTFEKRKLKQGGHNPKFKQIPPAKAQATLAGIQPIISQYEALLSKRQMSAAASKQLLSITPDKRPFLQVIIPLYNQSKYIKRCLESIARQQHCRFAVTIVDDASQDDCFEIVRRCVQGDPRFHIYKSIINGGPLHNIVRCINHSKATDKDVIVCVDGDDQLVGNDSLSIVADTYTATRCWLTYGSFITSHGVRRGGAYDRRTIRDNLFRVAPWYASHLKTFRHSLWSKLSDADLRDDDGHYFQAALDLAFMLPMLELAGQRQSYIPDILYVWNVDNAESISRQKRELQHRDAHIIRNRKRYLPVLEQAR